MKQALFLLAGLVAGVFLSQTLSHPQEASAASSPVYELRTYYTLPGRLPALQARFRNHTLKLFEKHGMKNIGYWVPQDAPKSENTLIYVISHASREAAKQNWDNFRNDPVWKQVAKESEADGKIVERVESVYMNATDYSPIK
ncbi:MAG: NIPSNAP family protein [Acidobacteria bacterium]|nr:NIPSNAP family protein [Acidobacteriota bacterium]